MCLVSLLSLYPLPEEPSASRGLGTSLLQLFGSLLSSKPVRDADGPPGWALGKELRALAQ